MKKRLFALFAFLFIVGDLFLLNFAIFLSYEFSGVDLRDEELSNEVYLFIFSNLAWFFLLLITNSYGRSSSNKLKIQIRSLFSFVFVQLLVLISLVFFFNKAYSSLQVALVYIIFIPAIIIWRLLYLYMVKSVVKGTLTNINYVIVGTGDLANKIRREFRLRPEYGYKFLGYFDDKNVKSDTMPLDKLAEFSARMGVNEIYCCWPETSQPDIKKIVDLGLNTFVKVKLVTDTSEFAQAGIHLERFDQIPVLDASAIPIDEERNQIIKRAFDLLFTFVVMLTVLIWLLPLIAVLIKLNSKGPVLFKQLRAGKGNKPFQCLKFRTMYVEDDVDFMQATKDDPRITSIGKILRKTSLDEFPQFINVIRGEMSIVGPRPHPMKLNDDFADRVRKLMSRHYVKPGITGLAQCLGYRGETKDLLDMKHRVTLDRFYVENWSLLLDVRIIFQTILSLLRGSEKAY